MKTLYLVFLILPFFAYSQQEGNIPNSPYAIMPQEKFNELWVLSDDSLEYILKYGWVNMYEQSIMMEIYSDMDSSEFDNATVLALSSLYILELRNVKNRTILYSAGQVYEGIKWHTKAIKYYTQSLTFNEDSLSKPSFAEIRQKRAKAKQGAEDYYGAINDYTYAIKYCDLDYKPFAYCDRGICYAAIKKSELALKDFNKAIELNNKLASAYFYRGLLYITKFNNKDKGCLDLSNAADLEYPQAYEKIKTYCR